MLRLCAINAHLHTQHSTHTPYGSVSGSLDWIPYGTPFGFACFAFWICFCQRPPIAQFFFVDFFLFALQSVTTSKGSNVVATYKTLKTTTAITWKLNIFKSQWSWCTLWAQVELLNTDNRLSNNFGFSLHFVHNVDTHTHTTLWKWKWIRTAKWMQTLHKHTPEILL